MQLLISDANILIDLEEGELIHLVFQLPYQFSIPDILFYEELSDQHQYLLGAGLQLNELNGLTMEYASTLIQSYKKTNRNDCFALALARQENCPLITGDRALRNAAKMEGITVKGTLWLVKKMILEKIITLEQASFAFRQMQDKGRRLPWDKISAMLHELD